MRINPMILKGAKSLFYNPFGKNKASKLTEAAVIIPLCLAGLEGALAIDAIKNGGDEDYKREKTLKGFTALAAAAGGIFGVGGALAAGIGWHLLSEDCKQDMI